MRCGGRSFTYAQTKARLSSVRDLAADDVDRSHELAERLAAVIAGFDDLHLANSPEAFDELECRARGERRRGVDTDGSHSSRDEPATRSVFYALEHSRIATAGGFVRVHSSG